MVIEDFGFGKTTKIKIATNIFIKKKTGKDKSLTLWRRQTGKLGARAYFLYEWPGALEGSQAPLWNFYRTKRVAKLLKPAYPPPLPITYCRFYLCRAQATHDPQSHANHAGFCGDLWPSSHHACSPGTITATPLGTQRRCSMRKNAQLSRRDWASPSNTFS